MNRIKFLREEKGLTQQDLADRLGGAKSTVAMYEKGNRKPSLNVLIKLSQIFNCSIDYLMGLTSYKNPKSTLENKLYELDLNNSEFDLMISALLDSSGPDIDNIIRSGSKIGQACSLCLDVIDDYGSSLNEYDDYPVEKVTNLINSLERNNVIHKNNKASICSNNNIKSNFTNIPVLGKIAAGQPILAEEHIEGYLPVDPNIYGMSTSEDLFYLRVSGESMNQKVKNGDYALIHKQDYAENGDIVVAIVNGDDEATLKKYKKLNDQFVLLEPMSSDPSIETITIDLKDTNFKIIGKAIGQFGKF